MTLHFELNAFWPKTTVVCEKFHILAVKHGSGEIPLVVDFEDQLYDDFVFRRFGPKLQPDCHAEVAVSGINSKNRVFPEKWRFSGKIVFFRISDKISDVRRFRENVGPEIVIALE